MKEKIYKQKNQFIHRQIETKLRFLRGSSLFNSFQPLAAFKFELNSLCKFDKQIRAEAGSGAIPFIARLRVS